MVAQKLSRQEMNVRILLSKTEAMAKRNDENENWRLPKFVETLEEMIEHLKTASVEVDAENIANYTKRLEFLKGLLDTQKIDNVMQKSLAMQMLAPSSALNTTVTQELYHTNVAACENDLRKELFQDSFGLRNRFTASEPSSSQEFDSIVRYHTDKHERIAENMLTMTRNMKEQSELAGKIIREDTKTLEKSSKILDNNYYQLHKQSNRLQDFISKSGWHCWIWIMLAIMIVIFINMVLFMKVAKKKN